MSFYSTALESFVFPAYYRARRRRYPEYRAFLEQSQWWPADRLHEFQWQELSKLLAFAFRSVPYYQRKYAAAGASLGDIRSHEDFAKLPPISREEINQNREELKATSTESKLILHSTGGSSGVPTFFYMTLDSYDWRSATMARAYSWTGCRPGNKTLYLWGAPVGHMSRAKACKIRLLHTARRELVINTFAQTTALWERTLHAALRFRAQYIVGYVSSIEKFAEYLLSINAGLTGISAVIGAAEGVSDYTRRLVQRAFNAPLFSTYGSREFMSVAVECDRHEGMHVNSENVIVESEIQQSSAILITDLHNYGTPLLRYRIGDIGVISSKACGCGRALPLLSRIDGRTVDLLRTRDGRIVSGIWFPHIFKEIPEVCEYQVQQKTIEEITISVVLRSPLPLYREKFIRAEFHKQFGESTRIEIRQVAALPWLPSGKRRVTIGMAGYPKSDQNNSAV